MSRAWLRTLLELRPESRDVLFKVSYFHMVEVVTMVVPSGCLMVVVVVVV
jgi:hypothetical protein